MKLKMIAIAIGIVAFGIWGWIARAQEPVTVSVFVREECGHCRDEKAFLEELQQTLRQASAFSASLADSADRQDDVPLIEVKYYDLADEANAELFGRVTSRYQLVKGTPLTLIKGNLLQGFDTAKTTGRVIRSLIEGEGENTTFEEIADGGAQVADVLGLGAVCADGTECGVDAPQALVRIPLIGKEINVGTFSLVSLSAVLGFIDGFNPCALWVLLMFLIILAQVGSRKKMIQYAGLFILAEAVMYYLILNVWFTAWDFVKLDRIVTPLVGLLALGSGIYFIYKFATYKETCDITSPEQKQTLQEKVKRLASKPLTIGVAVGILGLAFSVNVFEFACSIGIPQTFTKILELNQLGWLVRQAYMAVYILMYMVDDFLVFGLALWSFDKIGITHKYSKWSTLVGGLIMVALGAIMLVKPELLVF